MASLGRSNPISVIISTSWNKSTIDAVTTLGDKFLTKINNNGKYYASFIDIEKVFHTVDRNSQLQNLFWIGLFGKTLQTLRAVCNTKHQYIFHGGHKSRELPQSKDVAQADKLTGLLFSLNIPDTLFSSPRPYQWHSSLDRWFGVCQ